MVTLGGGVILDIFPPRRRRSRDLDRRLEFLQAMDSDDPKTTIGTTGRKRGHPRHRRRQDPLPTALFPGPRSARSCLNWLKRDSVRRLAQHPLRVMDRQCFDSLCRQSLAPHPGTTSSTNPCRQGSRGSSLHSTLFAGLSQTVFKSALAHLCARDQVELDRDRVRLRGSGVRLSADEARALDSIEQAFLGAGLQVPSVEEVIREVALPREQSRRLVALLARQKKLVKVSETLFFHADSIEGGQKKAARLQEAGRPHRCPHLQETGRCYPQVRHSAPGASGPGAGDPQGRRIPGDCLANQGEATGVAGCEASLSAGFNRRNSNSAISDSFFFPNR